MWRSLFRAVIFGFSLTALWTGRAYPEDPPRSLQSLTDLREDITLLNLLNGLNLGEEQTRQVLALAREARGLRQGCLARNKSLIAAEEAALSSLRQHLLPRDGVVSPEVERRAAELNHRDRESRESLRAGLKALEGRLDSVLTLSQRAILSDFQPCLIPPRHLKNPSRAGQARDTGPLEELLQRVRSLPEIFYARRKEMIFDRYLRKLEGHLGTLTEGEREEERKRFFSVLEEARSLSDVQFALEKPNLAARLEARRDQDQALLREIEVRRERKGDLGKAGRFLLDERIIPLLETRLNPVTAGQR